LLSEAFPVLIPALGGVARKYMRNLSIISGWKIFS